MQSEACHFVQAKELQRDAFPSLTMSIEGPLYLQASNKLLTAALCRCHLLLKLSGGSLGLLQSLQCLLNVSALPFCLLHAVICQ